MSEQLSSLQAPSTPKKQTESQKDVIFFPGTSYTSVKSGNVSMRDSNRETGDNPDDAKTQSNIAGTAERGTCRKLLVSEVTTEAIELPTAAEDMFNIKTLKGKV